LKSRLSQLEDEKHHFALAIEKEVLELTETFKDQHQKQEKAKHSFEGQVSGAIAQISEASAKH